MARLLSLLCVAALAAFAAGTTPPAARAGGGTQTFADPAGDATGGAPDIQTIVVSDDGADRFTVAVTTPNRPTLNGDDVIVVVLLTSDTTGVEVFYYGDGTSRVCAPIQDAANPACLPVAAPVGVVFSGGTTTFTIDASGLDVADMVAVGVVAAEAVDDNADHSDVGPVIAYQVATKTTTAAPSEADTVAPHVKALATSGTHGKPVKLSYRSWDNSGTTREEITVYQGSKRLWHTSTPYRATSQAKLHTVTWKVPKSVHGKLRFGVEAFDADDNPSGTVWATLTIR